MPQSDSGRQALGHIDAALRENSNDGRALSHATMCLAAFRDQLVAEWREIGSDGRRRKQLEHVNAVITIVLAAHFPLGEVPWEELRKARAWLAAAVAEAEPVA